MADSIKDFLIEVGFMVDSAGQAKVDTAVKQAEERITATVTEGVKKRSAVQQDATQERLDALASVIKEQTGQEVTLTKATVKAHEDRADRTHAIEVTNAKKSAILRSEQFKQAEAFLLRFGAVSEGVAVGLSGALRAAPFGAFLVGVERTASSLSNLAVQSQRVGTSASGIQRFMFALGQAGVSQGEATGALEGFSSTIKKNPVGYRQALERLGVRTTGPDGQPLGNAEMLENFGKALSGMPLNIAKVQAGAFGVDGDNALNALRDQSSLNRNLGAYDDKLRGFGMDPNRMAEDARKVEQAYGNLQTDLALINQKVQAEFFLPMMQGFDNMAKWVEAHPNVTENLEKGLVAFSAVMTLRVIPPLLRLTTALTGLSAISMPAWLLAALGLAVTPTAANAGEPIIRPDGSSVYPDGHVVPGKVWDGHSIGAPYVPPDNRNWWQRNAPKILGGQDAPTANKDGVSEGGGARLRQRRGSIPATTTPAPGANGFGRIDAPYNAPLDRKGEKGILAPRELFDYLKGQGATDNEALMLTGAAGSESSFNATAWHDNGNGYGLWGHNIRDRLDLRGNDWQTQARRALNEVKTKGYAAAVNGARSPEELAVAEMHYERPRGYRPANPRGGDNYTGRFHTLERFGQGFGVFADGASTGPIGDRAALDAEQRARTGRAQPGDAGLLGAYRQQQNTPPASGVPVKVDVVSQPLDPARQKLADAMNADLAKRHELAQHIVDLHKAGKLTPDYLMHMGGKHMVLGSSSISANRTHNERHGDTFHVHAKTAQEGMDAAVKVSARRGEQDKIRFGQGSQS